MKKRVLLLTSILGLSLLTACGKEAESTTQAETTTEVVTEEVTEEAETTNDATEKADNASESDTVEWTFGPYEYSGDDLVIKAISTYICDEFGKNYDTGDVGIPCPNILDVDSTDTSDVKAYGEYWYNTYSLKGDTLYSEAGGSYPGCIHLKQLEDGSYEVTCFDQVEDGTNYEESAKKIFGDLYDSFLDLSSDTEAREALRAKYISDFINEKGIPATKYQDYGWDPVELNAEQGGNEYMGGLYAADGESDINIALYRSEGTPIVIVQEGENIYYGEFTSEDAKLDDGTEYVKITVEGKTFGYSFDNPGEEYSSGLIVDQDGKPHTAKGLDKSVADEIKELTK